MRLSKSRLWAIVVVVLCIQAAQILYVVHRESLTFDEGNHMFAGYMMWEKHDYGLNPEHPPLVKLLATVPLLGEKLWIPPYKNDPNFKAESYLNGRDFLAHNDGASQRLVFRMRMMAGLLSIGLSLMAFVTARTFFGDVAGLIALMLVAFDPNALAHSALVTTDMGVSFFLLATVYTFYRYVKQPNWRSLVVAGIVGGLLLATKHSGILIAPILLLLILWESAVAPKGIRGRTAGRLLGAMGCMALIAVAVLWSFYGFRYAMRPAGLPHPTVAEYVRPLGPLSAAPVLFFAKYHLLPESYLIGLADVKRMAEWYSTFIFDKVYAHSVWWYFPVAITIKTTLGFLGMMVLGAIALVTRRLQKAREVIYVLTPALFYLLVAVLAGMNIGARHVLPFYAFMYIFAGAGAAALIAANRRWMWACGALLAAHIVSALTVFPNYMAYANEAWGGPKNVHTLLTDANVDWAQQLYSVKKWVDKHPGEECWFAYFAYPEIDPGVYGIPCHHLPTADTGWLGGSDIIPPTVSGNVMISAGDLSGGEWSADRDNPERKFKKMKPADVIDYAVFVYRGTFDMRDSATASRVQHAFELMRDKKGPEALALLKEAVAIDPQDVRSQTALGDVSAAMGMKEDARAAWTRALEIAHGMSAGDQAELVPGIEEKLRKL